MGPSKEVDKIFNQDQKERTHPRLGRTAAAGLIALSGALTGYGMVEAAQGEGQDRVETGDSILEERRAMTPSEAAEHGRQQAAIEAEKRASYQEAQNPDEMTPTPGLESSLNGTESATVAEETVTNPEITDQPHIIANEDKPMEAVGQAAGEAIRGDDS